MAQVYAPTCVATEEVNEFFKQVEFTLKPVHSCESNGLQMVCKPDAFMCGWDYEHELHHLWMVRIPFATNQNLSFFCTNIKGTECTMCSVFASGSWKINLPHT